MATIPLAPLSAPETLEAAATAPPVPETFEAAAAAYVPFSIAVEAARYVAAVDLFRHEGQPPTWRPETEGVDNGQH